jgi:NTE family protein
MNEQRSEGRSSEGSAAKVSLVLGSGGARGLAHIGVIQWLKANGYRIESIAGCSMGALVGGIHAAGRLADYRDWVCALHRADVLRFLDLAWSRSGLIKGDRIIETLREMVGEHHIEHLPIAYTAVATDIERQREVWISKGPLFDAIRASIAVPTVFMPHEYLGRKLVDGGLLNPVPIAPTFRDLTDLTIAVNLNGNDEGAPWPPQAPPALPEPGAQSGEGADAAAQATPPKEAPSRPDDLRGRILAFLDDVANGFTGKPDEDAEDDGHLDVFELVSRSLETMQNAIAAVKLAAYTPDVIVNIPRDVCQAHEFHRAQELIEIGERIAEQELSAYERRRAKD